MSATKGAGGSGDPGSGDASAAVSLLRELVAIPSVSGAEEACRDHLGAWLDAHGVNVRAHGRNLIAVIVGSARVDAPAPGLLFCSHYDVVPIGKGWTRDPWDGALEQGKVFGRGSNDAKSSIAAMAVAAVGLDRAAFAGNLVLAFVCDEETGGEGIEICLDELPECAAAVVGEPTGLDVCRGQRGLLRAEIVARGRACHASRPWEGDNALVRAARDVLAVHALSERALDRPHELLGAPTLTATMLEGSTRPNVVPGECAIQLDGRPTPECDNQRMLELLRAAVEGEVVVRSTRFGPVITEAGEPIVRAATAASPSGVVRGFGGVSDYFHLRHLPGVVMGPGTSEASHAPDEWVAVDQVHGAVAAYGSIARSMLAPGDAPARDEDTERQEARA